MSLQNRTSGMCDHPESGEVCATTVTTTLGQILELAADPDFSDPDNADINFWYNNVEDKIKVRESGGTILSLPMTAEVTTTTTVNYSTTTTTTTNPPE